LTIIVLSNESNAPVNRVADELGALYLGIPARAAAPGGEKTLRAMIDGLGNGDPDYNLLSADMAKLTRDQLPALHALISGLGPLKSIELVEAEPGGSDLYRATFEKGVQDWDITLQSDGKVQGARFEPVS